MGVTGITQEKIKLLTDEIQKVVVGQYEFIQNIVICLLSEGHILVEGVPGIAKTLTAKVMSMALGFEFKRVQFTPDLMPADVIGTKVFDLNSSNFYMKYGPIFTNIFLADEINRTPPKTQSALLESMEEKSITLDGTTYKLDNPFFVVATQNPVEYEGTYPLPEAQLDRFMMKIVLEYAPQSFENKMLSMVNSGFDSSKIAENTIQRVFSKEDFEMCKKEILEVEVKDSIINYITSIVKATRQSPSLLLGASPRASIALLKVCKTFAAVKGRNFVTPEDVKDFALPVLRHRIIIRPEASIEGISNDKVILNILNKVEIPR